MALIAQRPFSQLIVFFVLGCAVCLFQSEDSDGSIFGLTINVNKSLSNRLAVSAVSRHICGSEIFCTNDGENVTKGLCSYECSRCKCDDTCHFYGDCCPAKLFEYSREKPSEKRDFVTCSGESNRLWGNESHIFMVSKCPNNTYLEKSVVDQCEFPDITLFAEATPVSDMATQITYVNEFCARCHGIKHFQIWSQNVSCHIEADLGMARTKEELWRLVMTDKTCAAKLQSVPPVGVKLRVCYPSVIDKCNVTGRWVKNLNPVAEVLCGMYQHTVHYYGTSNNYVSYRNVFCAICNGAWLERIPCQRHKDILPPPPSVLLMFNPPKATTTSGKVRTQQCQLNHIYDPFSVACREMSCPPRRVLDQGSCRVPYLSTAGLGFSYHQELRTLNATLTDVFNFVTEYTAVFKQFFEDQMPILSLEFIMGFLGLESNNSTFDFIRVEGKFVSQSNTSVMDMEHQIEDFLSMSWTYYDDGNNTNTTLLSSHVTCAVDMAKTKGRRIVRTKTYRENDSNIKLSSSIPFTTLQLDCPYLQYDMSLTNFTYNPATSTAWVEENKIYLNRSRISLCNETLIICSDVLRNISGALDQRTVHRPRYDRILSIVSLVCIILSLVSLVATFVVFSLVAKLRTAPGKNTMALLFHLFCAQLVFLSLSNRVEIRILCQVFGVLIHYFWITTFTWMMALAYQMHKVFANFPSLSSNCSMNQKLVWKYLLVCDLTALIPVIVCIAYYLITTDGEHVGYGRTICFLNDAWAIGAFFAAPLCIMLLFNAVCFARTFLTVGCRQQVESDSVTSNINYVFIYVKLSVLFGFSWAFGILAAILNSLVLWYVFVILTGCQGVFIFLTYCVNERTWASVKTTLSERSTSRSSRTSCNPS